MVVLLSVRSSFRGTGWFSTQTGLYPGQDKGSPAGCPQAVGALWKRWKSLCCDRSYGELPPAEVVWEQSSFVRAYIKVLLKTTFTCSMAAFSSCV